MNPEGEPMVFPFGWSEQPQLVGCVFLFMLMIGGVGVFSFVQTAQRKDYGDLPIASIFILFPALVLVLILIDRARGKRSKARIELAGNVISQYAYDGTLMVSKPLSEVRTMLTGNSGPQSTTYAYLLTFEDGQEIFFDERIDLCWKLAKIVKQITGREFERGTVRMRRIR